MSHHSDFYLSWRNQNVEHAEVLLEAMPHKNAANIHQIAQLQVGLLQGGEVMG